MLRERDAAIWKAALDSLVMIGGQAALNALAFARETATAQKREWIIEASPIGHRTAVLVAVRQAGIGANDYSARRNTRPRKKAANVREGAPSSLVPQTV